MDELEELNEAAPEVANVLRRPPRPPVMLLDPDAPVVEVVDDVMPVYFELEYAAGAGAATFGAGAGAGAGAEAFFLSGGCCCACPLLSGAGSCSPLVGVSIPTLKKGYWRHWAAVGRFWGLYSMLSVIILIASALACGISCCKGVAENCGNLKFILAANCMPSGQILRLGEPSTEQTL